MRCCARWPVTAPSSPRTCAGAPRMCAMRSSPRWGGRDGYQARPAAAPSGQACREPEERTEEHWSEIPLWEARAARNAFKHGLAAPAGADPGLRDRIEALSRLIAG